MVRLLARVRWGRDRGAAGPVHLVRYPYRAGLLTECGHRVPEGRRLSWGAAGELCRICVARATRRGRWREL